jgi:predicted enzyme related to lactoylglutathione lyase
MNVMEMVTHAFGWVEIPVSDFARAKKFYSAIFDYEMPEMPMGPNMMGILLYDQANGGVGGAIVKGEGYVPSEHGPRVYLNGGSDLAIVLGRVAKAGGTVLLPKTLVTPDIGYFGMFRDPEGNLISIHSTK